jgi:hypothetical protein
MSIPNPAAMPARKPHLRARARRDKPIPTEPEDRRHAEDSETLRLQLSEAGIVPKQIYPTYDRDGWVTLTFEQVRALLRTNNY